MAWMDALQVEVLLLIIAFLVLLVVVLFFWRKLSLAQLRSRLMVLETELKDCEEDLGLAQAEIRRLQQESLANKSITQLLEPFKTQLEGFQKRVNDVHTQSVAGNAELRTQIAQLMQMGMMMGQEAQHLANALKGNKKVLGNWGEMQLESILEKVGLLKNTHYFMQQSYKNQEGDKQIPDVVLKLPQDKQLIIDSKVSLSAYQQAVNEESAERVASHLKTYLRDVRHHIDSLAKKDYSALIEGESLGFVLMFMPIEAAYIEALRLNEELFQYAYSKGVVLVSPNTLMPTLRTIANLWLMANSNKQAMEIGDKALDIYNQVVVVAEHLQKVGASLQITSKHYNQVLTSLTGQQGLVGKVERFKDLSTKHAKKMPSVEPIIINVENERLQGVLKDN